MKRIAAFLCAIALLLTACSRTPAPETTAASTAAPTTAAEPTTAATELPPEPVTTAEPAGDDTGESLGGLDTGEELNVPEPETTEPAPTEPEEPVDWTVRVDWSVYRPRSGVERKYTRLREGPLDHFEPSEDYGAVYPYVASRLYHSEPNGYGWEAGGLYGFVDASGRILTDGIYSDVHLLSNYDYERNINVYRPFWLIQRVTEAKLVEEHYEGGSYTWVDGVTRYGLVSPDGSFLLPMEYRGISILGDGFLCTREWDGVSFEVYDAQGKLLFTGADVIGSDKYTGSYLTDGGDGLYLLTLYGEEGQRCWYCDAEGNRVLGPYAEAGGFSEGLACASLNGSYYGFIDRSGVWVIDPQFTGSGNFQNGKAVVSDQNQRSCVIDRTGQILLTAKENTWFYRAACGFGLNGSTETVYYDFDLKPLYRGDSVYLVDENTFCDSKEEGSVFFRADGARLELPQVQVYSFSPFMALLDGVATRGYLCFGYHRGQSSGKSYFIPEDLSAYCPIGDKGTPTADSYRAVYYDVDQFTGETWYLSWNGQAWEALNDAGELHILPLRAGTLYLRGDRIMALTKTACVYYDWEGNLLFSYPLDSED